MVAPSVVFKNSATPHPQNMGFIVVYIGYHNKCKINRILLRLVHTRAAMRIRSGSARSYRMRMISIPSQCASSGGDFDAHSPSIQFRELFTFSIITHCVMQIMATKPAWISGVKNTHLLSNVRTNGRIELEHRTDQDETTVNWTIWWVTCEYVAWKAIMVLFLWRVFSIAAIPSIVKVQLSAVEQQN